MVAQTHDLHTLLIDPTANGLMTTHAQTHEAHAEHIDLGSGEVERIFLTSGALGNLRHNDAILHLVRPVELSHCRCGQQHDGAESRHECFFNIHIGIINR